MTITINLLFRGSWRETAVTNITGDSSETATVSMNRDGTTSLDLATHFLYNTLPLNVFTDHEYDTQRVLLGLKCVYEANEKILQMIHYFSSRRGSNVI